ncbi:MAG: hypothetical protein SFU91_13290 [Chloroherpetonaceae bacterium]|nr:hypothetical protein [Chloroherpetonaceae bacterium]
MQTISLKLVTIIADEVLEERLIEEIQELGAKGYTIQAARGGSQTGERISEWEGENIRLEVLASEEVAEKILNHLSKTYLNKYSMITYITAAEVLRGNKFM